MPLKALLYKKLGMKDGKSVIYWRAELYELGVLVDVIEHTSKKFVKKHLRFVGFTERIRKVN